MQTNWDLKKHFYSIDDERIEKDIEYDIKEIYEFIEKHKGNISKYDDNDFFNYLEENENLFLNVGKIATYYNYLATLDTQDQDIIKKLGELSNRFKKISSDMLFINEEYKLIGYNKLIERSNNALFKDYKNSLKNDANDIKYLLSEKEENILIHISDETSVADNIYDELTNSFTFDFKGEEKTKAEIYSLRLSPDEEERELANKLLYEKYGDHKIVLGNIYKTICKRNKRNIELRGYDNVMTSRNESEELSDEVVNKLIKNVKSNYNIFHNYLKIKAKLLGKKRLEFSDVLAPIPLEIETEIPFEESYNKYLSYIREFDEDLYNYSKDMFDDGRVDVFPNKGKQGGAFSSSDRNRESFVMLNHTPNFDSMMTLAHELGHAYHGHISRGLKSSEYHPPLSLAETASIFSETLVFDKVLSEITASDSLEQLAFGFSSNIKNHYLVQNLDGIFSTMFRQIMYTDFERECHQRTLAGEELSYDDFNEIWYEKSKEYYGDNVNLPEYVKYGWSVIPHIFATPFYCYAYSFGNILSFNLYNLYKRVDDCDQCKEGFIETYKYILKSGGSVPPEELLKSKGILIDDKFFENAFNIIEDLIGELSIDI